MSTDGRYSGWSNYPTWRINLEVASDYLEGLQEDRRTFADTYALSKHLEGHVSECMAEDLQGTFYGSYAEAFVSDVNWYEIAEAYPDLIDDDSETDEEDGE